MTAEIAVLNKSAVALAADSAVTIGRGSSAKIYNSVNKIFELHETAPVGVMVYGRLDYMGLPLETLINLYRKQLGLKTFYRVSDYKADFVRWLSEDVPIHKDNEDHIVLLSAVDLLEGLGKKIDQQVLAEIRRRGRYLPSKDNSVAQDVIQHELDAIKQKPKLTYAKRNYVSGLESQFGAVIDRAISVVITQIAPSQQTKEALHRLVIEAITREHFSSFRTGIVIAGFGDEDRCPSLERFEMEGIIGGQLKYVDGPPVDISRRALHAEALGFAQSDMIERFLHGIDPELYEYARSTIKHSITELATEIVSAFTGTAVNSTNLPPSIEKVIKKIQDDRLKKLEDYKTSEYTKPIVDMICHMPKQELANLARALIDLTSLKRRVSREQESVGGEVDVAVISKSEGFVWVKRKHYFPSEINHRFFARHYQKQQHGNA